MFFEKKRNFRFQHFSTGDTQNHRGKFFIGCLEVDSIHIKKDQCGHGADPFVAVDKRMIFHNFIRS